MFGLHRGFGYAIFLTAIALILDVNFVCGQNSHLQGLIETWKAENPQARQTDNPSNSTRRSPPRQTDYRDENLLANVPDPYRQLDAGTTSPVLPVGNPKDPLNFRFHPEWSDSSNRPAMPYDEPLSDARLNDVFFLNPFLGWAVGDRGVVWHTSDGGENWTLQETPIACTLRSVYFVNETFGIAVGGYPFPFSSQGRGVVLTTSDGGKTWTMLPMRHYPIFHRIKMFDSLKGVIAGESSEHCPTGLYSTADGGRTWKALPGDKGEGWTSIEFQGEKSGVGIDVQGALHSISASKPIQTSGVEKTRFSQIQLFSAPAGYFNGWMVGDGGRVMSTTDGGFRWGAVSGKLPGNTASLVDLKTIDSRGPRLWVAGSPGTFVYFSPDVGKTWKAFPTESNAPIRKIKFINEKIGWAVGDLGTILSTKDGGETWTNRRAGAKRLAALGLFARAEEIPFEAFAQICANQGYIGGVTVLFRDEDRQREIRETAWMDRVHEATIRTGASGAWELGPFSIGHDELRTTMDHLVEQIEKAHDGKGIAKLRERLVLAIRQWTPEIILTSSLGESKDPVRELALREIMNAVEAAADPQAYSDQITELALKPWKVKKVHCVLDDGQLGDVHIATTEPSIRLGQPIDEFVYLSHGMIDTKWKSKPAILGFSTVLDEFPGRGNKDFFSGIDVPFEEARRAFLGSFDGQSDEIFHRIKQRRNVLGIIQNMSQIAESSGHSGSGMRLASHAEELTRKIDQDAAAQILVEMGRQFHARGDWDSAWEAYDLLARQHSNHPLARQAFLWLIQYYAGDEVAWSKQQSGIWTDWEGTTANLAVRSGSAVPPEMSVSRLNKAIELTQYLERNFPDLAADPQIRFATAAALRQRGWGPEAAKIYKQRADSKYDDVWSMRARAEHWLSIPDKSELRPELQELPMPSILCSYTPIKPYLDGRFDKQYDRGTWFESKLYSLTPDKPRQRLQEILKDKQDFPGLRRTEKLVNESKTFGTQVMFMYDQEFLYIGIRCKKVPGISYSPIAERPRVRDTSIDNQDRVEILLDTDRDYGTYYTLTLDARGWAVDACWGNKTWNPNCHIAPHADKEYWYIEMAVSLDSLASQQPLPQTVWGVGIRRIVPGVGIECWNAENSLELSEGLGLLFFE